MRHSFQNTVVVLGVLLLLPRLLAAQSVFDGLSKTTPAPATFCPYAPSSAWRQPLPENPTQVLTSENPEARSYITNIGQNGVYWRAAGDNHFSSCYRPNQASDGFDWAGQPWYHCGGNTGFSAFVASDTDPLVTYHCKASDTSYGCVDGGTSVAEITAQIRVPHNLVPTCNWTAYCGDINWGVVQPDGTTYEMYGCEIHQDLLGGELLGTPITADPRTPVCQHNGVTRTSIGGGMKDNLVTGQGRNATVNSGPNAWALQAYYNQVGVANPQPHAALWMNVSCNGPGYRYPATSSTNICSDHPGDMNSNGRGLPTGTHIQLTLTHAQIDQAITNGQVPAAFRGILYAAHDYGIYFGDTGSDSTPKLTIGWLEDVVQHTANGAVSAWTSWFQSLVPYGAVLSAGTGESGANTYYVQYNPFYQFANNFQVVDECYAHGTCPDSVAPNTAACSGCPTPCCAPTCPGGCAINCPTAEAGPLIGHWKFDEGTGTTAVDTTSTANNLTLTAGTTWVAGRIGTALGCSATGSATTPTMLMPATLRYSWAFWAKASTLPAAATQVQQFWEIATGTGGNDAYGFNYADPSNSAILTAYHRLSNGDYVKAGIPPATPMTAGTWYHYGATYDGAVLKMFLNGQVVATTPATSAMAPTGTLSVCGRWPGGGTAAIDDLQVWNTALTDVQMQQEFTGTVVRRVHRPFPSR